MTEIQEHTTRASNKGAYLVTWWPQGDWEPYGDLYATHVIFEASASTGRNCVILLNVIHKSGLIPPLMVGSGAAPYLTIVLSEGGDFNVSSISREEYGRARERRE